MELVSLVHCHKITTYPTQVNVEGSRGGMRKNPVVENGKHQLKFIFKTFVPPFIAALVTFSPIFNTPVSFAHGVDIQRGAKLFSQSCIGCHDGGGNIIQPGATLFLKDLQRNEVDNEDAIYKITYSGKERMPGFGMNCTPRGQCTFGPRLTDDEIKALAEFVKSQADQGWPDIGIITD